VPVYHVTVGQVVDAPQRVHNLISGQQASGIGCQQVEQILLQWREVQLAGPSAHPAIQNVDLQLSESVLIGSMVRFLGARLSTAIRIVFTLNGIYWGVLLAIYIAGILAGVFVLPFR
jgi:hypothetical protein